MLMEVVTPEEFLGDVLGDLQSRQYSSPINGASSWTPDS